MTTITLSTIYEMQTRLENIINKSRPDYQRNVEFQTFNDESGNFGYYDYSTPNSDYTIIFSFGDEQDMLDEYEIYIKEHTPKLSEPEELLQALEKVNTDTSLFYKWTVFTKALIYLMREHIKNSKQL